MNKELKNINIAWRESLMGVKVVETVIIDFDNEVDVKFVAPVLCRACGSKPSISANNSTGIIGKPKVKNVFTTFVGCPEGCYTAAVSVVTRDKAVNEVVISMTTKGVDVWNRFNVGGCGDW